MHLKRRIERIEAAASMKRTVSLQEIVDKFIHKISDAALELLLEHVRARQASLPQNRLGEIQGRIYAALSPEEQKYYRIWRTLKYDDFLAIEKILLGHSSDDAA